MIGTTHYRTLMLRVIMLAVITTATGCPGGTPEEATIHTPKEPDSTVDQEGGPGASPVPGGGGAPGGGGKTLEEQLDELINKVGQEDLENLCKDIKILPCVFSAEVPYKSIRGAASLFLAIRDYDASKADYTAVRALAESKIKSIALPYDGIMLSGANSGNLDFIKLSLFLGCPVDQVFDYEGGRHTAVYIADRNGHKAIVDYLLANGGKYDLKEEKNNFMTSLKDELAAQIKNPKMQSKNAVEERKNVIKDWVKEEIIEDRLVKITNSYPKVVDNVANKVEILVGKLEELKSSNTEHILTKCAYYAIKHNYSKAVSFLVGKLGKNAPEQKDKDKLVDLVHLAIKKDYKDLTVVKPLVDKLDKVGLDQKDKATLLACVHLAIKKDYKDLTVVELLVDKLDKVGLDQKDKATLLACVQLALHKSRALKQKYDLTVVKPLVGKLDQVGLEPKDKATLLDCVRLAINKSHALKQKYDLTVVKSLVGKLDKVCLTPENLSLALKSLLSSAIYRGSLDSVKFFIEKKKVDVNSRFHYNKASKNNGETALIKATRSSHLAIVEYLLEQGADKELKSDRGKTALDLAQELCGAAGDETKNKKDLQDIIELLKPYKAVIPGYAGLNVPDAEE